MGLCYVALPAGGWNSVEGMNYIAFIHGDDAGYGISFPDFPGCISTGTTTEDVIRHGAEALAFHIEGMVEDGLPIPRPRSARDVETDSSLAEWRKGATLGWVGVPLAARFVDGW